MREKKGGEGGKLHCTCMTLDSVYDTWQCVQEVHKGSQAILWLLTQRWVNLKDLAEDH